MTTQVLESLIDTAFERRAEIAPGKVPGSTRTGRGFIEYIAASHRDAADRIHLHMAAEFLVRVNRQP